MRAFLTTLIIALSFTFPALASSQTETAATMPKPLMEQKLRGAQVYYLGKFDTLDGWLMVRTGTGQPEFYYATPDNKALVMGFLFNGEGELQTSEQLKVLDRSREAGLVDIMKSHITPDGMPTTAAPVAPADIADPASSSASVADTLVPNTPANKLFIDLTKANSVLWGQTDVPMFYALIDPNCTHCRHFLREAEGPVNEGKISIRILPVGFDKKSKAQAAFVLSSADGIERLVNYAKGDTKALPAPETMNTSGIEGNMKLVSNWRLTATPMIIYKAGKTGEIRIIRGRPLDMAAAIQDLRGE